MGKRVWSLGKVLQCEIVLLVIIIDSAGIFPKVVYEMATYIETQLL